MKRLQAKVTHDEKMFKIYEARRRKSKQPSSLTLEQENRARDKFYANQIPGPCKTGLPKEIISLININSDGLIDNSIYTRFK